MGKFRFESVAQTSAQGQESDRHIGVVKRFMGMVNKPALASMDIVFASRNARYSPKENIPRSLQCKSDVVIWMMFEVAPALAVSALKGPSKDTQNPGYENPCKWFAGGITPLRV